MDLWAGHPIPDEKENILCTTFPILVLWVVAVKGHRFSADYRLDHNFIIARREAAFRGVPVSNHCRQEAEANQSGGNTKGYQISIHY
jgi:hypothetical protein